MNEHNAVRLRGRLGRVKHGQGNTTAWAFAGIKPTDGKSFIDVSAFGGNAEMLGRAKEGDEVEVRGHLERQKRKDSEVWELRVVADEITIGPAEEAF